VATPVRKTHLGYIDAHEPQRDESHYAQTPISTAVSQSDGIQFRSRLDSSDRNKDMTQADVDGTPDLTEYYQEVTENHSAVMGCWNQVSRGVISSVSAAVCGNIGLHLMETSTIRWSLVETDGLQQDDFISKLLELHQPKKEEAMSQRGSATEKLAREQKVAAQHFLPAILTISECRVKKFAILERASYHNQMDVPVYGSDLHMGNGTTVKLSVAKPTDSEKYSHRWEAQAGTIVLRESKKLSVANSTRETPVFLLTDRLTNSLGDAVHSGNFDGHHPAQLRLLLDTLKHSTNTLSNLLHHMAQKY
jgi:hypothetical protein